MEESNFGVLCITPENLTAEWLLFEAGALAKSVEKGLVVPLLYGLDFSEVSGPLAHFQAKKFERSGLEEVVLAVNRAAEQAVPEARVRELFSLAWPKVEESLENLPPGEPAARDSRSIPEILEELVTLTRGVGLRVRDLRRFELERTLAALRSGDSALFWADEGGFHFEGDIETIASQLVHQGEKIRQARCGAY